MANGEKEEKLSQGTDSGLTKPSDRGLDNCGVVAGNSGDGEKGTSGSDTWYALGLIIRFFLHYLFFPFCA